MLKLATFGDVLSAKGCIRHDENVISIHGVEIDYDGEELSFTEARDRLTHCGIECVLYTSASHTPEKAAGAFYAQLRKQLPPPSVPGAGRGRPARADDRDRRAGVRLQEPRRHRPDARLRPPGDGHPRRRARRRPVRRAARSRQPGERRLGGYRLPFAGQPGDPRKTQAASAVPAGEAQAQADAGAHPLRQRHPAKVRAKVEHVFAAQKRRLQLVIHTVGLARAAAKITLANLAYNFTRLAWLQGRTACA
jgi:hypothetical protein